MIDQLTSHAQLGVTLQCGVRGLAPSCVKDGHPHQRSNSKSFLVAAADRAIDAAKGAPQESFLARAAQQQQAPIEQQQAAAEQFKVDFATPTATG